MWWLERYLTEGSARLPRCDGGRSEAVEPRAGRSLTTIPSSRVPCGSRSASARRAGGTSAPNLTSTGTSYSDRKARHAR